MTYTYVYVYQLKVHEIKIVRKYMTSSKNISTINIRRCDAFKAVSAGKFQRQWPRDCRLTHRHLSQKRITYITHLHYTGMKYTHKIKQIKNEKEHSKILLLSISLNSVWRPSAIQGCKEPFISLAFNQELTHHQSWRIVFTKSLICLIAPPCYHNRIVLWPHFRNIAASVYSL
jgi:hypothetical protein